MRTSQAECGATLSEGLLGIVLPHRQLSDPYVRVTAEQLTALTAVIEIDLGLLRGFRGNYNRIVIPPATASTSQRPLPTHDGLHTGLRI